MKQKLEEAISGFLEGLEAANRAPKTIRWYSDILARFAAHDGELTDASLLHYLAVRRKEPGRKGPTISSATLCGEYRALRHFCAWLVKKGRLGDDPMKLVDRPMNAETIPRIATAQTALLLVSATEQSAWPSRDRALVMVLADTGARLAEFLQIAMDNLRVIHQNGIEYGEAMVIGKGNRRRRLLIGPAALSDLTTWIADRPEGADNCIWWSERGAPLSQTGVRLILKRLSVRAGLKEAINPHAFRHGFAIEHLENGADVRVLQLMMGHSQLTTTAKYLNMADTLVSDAHDRVSQARFGRPK